MLVLYSNHTSIMHRLRSNQVLPLAENYVIVLSPLGGAASYFLLRNWRGRPRLYILVFNSNHKHASIAHRLRYNQALPLTGNDILVLSPLGGRGAAKDFSIRNWKVRPRHFIHGAFTFCVYLKPFTSYSTFYSWLGF
jgi:hypothetical protein